MAESDNDPNKECQLLRAERDLLRMLIDHVPVYVLAKDRAKALGGSHYRFYRTA